MILLKVQENIVSTSVARRKYEKAGSTGKGIGTSSDPYVVE